MPTLIACLSSGKGTWSEVLRIIQGEPWQHVFLVTDSFGQEKFPLKREHLSFVLVNIFQETPLLVTAIKQQLQGKIADFEVGLNLASGSGKEHMAVLQAVMELGLNFRLVTLKNQQPEVLGLERNA